MVAVTTSLVLGSIVLLGGGWFASSLVASLAEPVSLILAAVAGGSAMIKLIRSEEVSQFFSSDAGELVASGLFGAFVFFLTFVAAQSLITALSPLAGVLVVALGVAVFFAGPGILVDLVAAVVGLLND